jgi:hypothetical protein
MRTNFNLIQSLRSWFFGRDGDVTMQTGRKIVVSGANIQITNGDIVVVSGTVTIDGTAVSVAGHTHSVTHASTTGQTANDHHAEAHTVASHSDTTATGTELETLTDGSNADSLHAHAAPSHTIASHSDTTATGTELETLTDGSDASTLHIHDGRYFQESEFVSTATVSAPLEADANGGLAVERLGVNAAIPSADGVIAIDGYLLMDEIAAPGTPSAGKAIIFIDTSNNLALKRDNGDNWNFYPTSVFDPDPGAAALPLRTDSNGYLTVRGLGVGSGTPTTNDIDVSGDVNVDGLIDTGGSVRIASGGVLRLAERSAPGAAPSGFAYLYMKTDSRLYYKNDGGTEYGPL